MRKIKPIKMFELFSGIGAPRSALINRAIPYESKGWSEVDKFAIRSYELLYNDTDNYGDIKKLKSIPKDLDLLFHGSPCQDFSTAGKGTGGEIGSGTRSSLLWHTVRLVKEARPKVLIWENVRSVTFKKHRSVFDRYLKYLEKLGYTNSWKVLEGVDYGIPQTRPRVFVVSTLKQQAFKWPDPIPLRLKLFDVIEPIVDTKFYLTQKKLESIVFTNKMNDTISDKSVGYCLGSRELKVVGFKTDTVGTLSARDYKDPHVLIQKVANLDFIKFNAHKGVYSPDGVVPTLQCCGIPIKCNTKQGYMIGNIGDGCYISIGNKRGTVQKDKVPTLTTACDIGVVIKDSIPYIVRKLTPREYWRLMGFKDEQFDKAATEMSNTQLYKQAGNSIIVPILEHIFTALVEQGLLGEDVEMTTERVHREISHSQLSKFKKCRRQFKYAYIDKLEAKGSRRALVFGSDLHELEEAYQDDKQDSDNEGLQRVSQVMTRIKKDFKELPEEDKAELGHRYVQDLGMVFKSFIYARNRNESYKCEELIMNEQEFKIKLSDYVTLKGVIDRVVKIGNKHYIKELKTYGKYKPKVEDLVWQAQHYLYAQYIQKVHDIKIAGFIYEYVNSTPPTAPDISKKGLLMRHTNGYTTTSMFKAKLKRKPNKQEALVLADADSKYYVRIMFPFNQHTADTVLTNFKAEANRIVEAIASKDYHTFLADAFLCGYCDYKKLCDAVYTLGPEAEQELMKTYHCRKEVQDGKVKEF